MLDALFHALSDPTRRAMLERLAEGEASVSELGQPFEMTPQAVSKHVRVLEEAGLVKRTVDGRVHRLTLEPRALEPVARWVETYQRFWKTQMDALAAYVEGLASEGLPSAAAAPGDKKKKAPRAGARKTQQREKKKRSSP